MRTRIDISPKSKELLKQMQKEVAYTGISMKEIVELCIQTGYENLNSDQASREDEDPVFSKLKEIKSLLEDVLPEI